DKLVTGVQTCALPIFLQLRTRDQRCAPIEFAFIERESEDTIRLESDEPLDAPFAQVGRFLQADCFEKTVRKELKDDKFTRWAFRSEERRVGKEGRCRW